MKYEPAGARSQESSQDRSDLTSDSGSTIIQLSSTKFPTNVINLLILINLKNLYTQQFGSVLTSDLTSALTATMAAAPAKAKVQEEARAKTAPAESEDECKLCKQSWGAIDKD